MENINKQSLIQYIQVNDPVSKNTNLALCSLLELVIRKTEIELKLMHSQKKTNTI